MKVARHWPLLYMTLSLCIHMAPDWPQAVEMHSPAWADGEDSTRCLCPLAGESRVSAWLPLLPSGQGVLPSSHAPEGQHLAWGGTHMHGWICPGFSESKSHVFCCNRGLFWNCSTATQGATLSPGPSPTHSAGGWWWLEGMADHTVLLLCAASNNKHLRVNQNAAR